MMRSESMPFGSGIWIRMPSTRSSSFSRFTSASSSASLVVAGRSCAKDSMPTSTHDLRLLRTYTVEAGSSPTCTTASPGLRPNFAGEGAGPQRRLLALAGGGGLAIEDRRARLHLYD